MEHWNSPVDAQIIATRLHDPECNPNEKINEIDGSCTYKACSGLICSWMYWEGMHALLSWRGLVDTNQIVAEFWHGEVIEGIHCKHRRLYNLHDLQHFYNLHLLSEYDEGRALAGEMLLVIDRYTENPNQVRKECRMRFDVCKQHDSAAVFAQILFLSNNYFVKSSKQ